MQIFLHILPMLAPRSEDRINIKVSRTYAPGKLPSRF